MTLKTNDKPLVEPKIGQEFTLSNNNIITVTHIDENKQIEIDKKQVQWYSFGCLTDCEFQMATFKAGSLYYQLIFDVAGGGASKKFDQIVKSITFANP